MATARRGSGVSWIDRMKKSIARKADGDLVANWDKLDEDQKKFLNGVYGGTTKIRPRNDRRELMTANNARMKVAILPFGTKVPETVTSGELHYFVGGITKYSATVLAQMCEGDYKTAANWKTMESYTGDDVKNLKSGVWPAYVTARFAKKGAGSGELIKYTGTKFDGTPVTRVDSYSGQCIFGAEVGKLTGVAAEEAEVASQLMGVLKNAKDEYSSMGVKYTPEFIGVTSSRASEEYSETGLPTLAFG